VKNPAPIKARNRNHEHDRKSYVAPPADDIGYTINQECSDIESGRSTHADA
jgi:hypothetical protein